MVELAIRVLIPILEQSNGGIPLPTDYMKSVFTAFQLALHDEYRIPLSAVEDEGNSTAVYVSKITEVGSVNTGVLQQCIPDKYAYIIRDTRPVPEQLTLVEQALNIALKTRLQMQYTPVGRFSFYNTDQHVYENQSNLGAGLAIWKGFSTVLTMGWKVFVNVDIANTAFVKGQGVYDALTQVANYSKSKVKANPTDASSYSKGTNRADALKLLKGVMVEYQTSKNTKLTGRVTDILPTPPRENRFSCSDGKETNVEQYFKTAYKIKLRHRNGLCLQIRGRSVVPAELCIIRKGQAFNGKLNDAQTTKMTNHTAVAPAMRLETIKGNVEQIKLDEDRILKSMGLTVGNELHKMEARVLPPPTLVYLSKNVQQWVTPSSDGVWNMFERRGGVPELQFIVPATTKLPAAQGLKWGVINAAWETGVSGDALFVFVNRLCNMALHAGLQLGSAEDVMDNYLTINEPADVGNALQEFAKSGLQMTLVIVPEKNKVMYGTIKTEAEIKLPGNGILTQVVLGETVENVVDCRDDATVRNILYKINSKLGGTNYYMHSNYNNRQGQQSIWTRIDLLRAPVLIIGVDVTHPGFDSKFPSFAAVTASVDRTGMPFQMHIQAQAKAGKGAAEVITGLDQIVKNFIMNFVSATKHKPRKIIYYRDGVGDGQFGEVLQVEMMAIREGCRLVGQFQSFFQRCEHDCRAGEVNLGGRAYEPKITFIVVQKRHKLRFFPYDPNEGVGMMQNAPPGTIVDKDIVKATISDFYLLSHTGIRGTSRPTRYQVLWDDSDFSPDQLHLLTYYLCYMYCRCTRSVSYPAATYYAHLGALRAKSYAETLDSNGEVDMSNVAEVTQRIQRNPRFRGFFKMHFV